MDQLLQIDLTTKLWTIGIFVASLAALIWIIVQRRRDQLLENRNRIENLPSLISTLGVLGTFFGITKGLTSFDPNDLNTSIPALLDGLKTAFYTSLAGMFGSLILSSIVNRFYDKKEKGVSDINAAAGQIVEAVQRMSETLITQSTTQANNQNAFYIAVGQKLQSIESKIPSVDALLIQSQALCALLAETKELINGNATNIAQVVSELSNVASNSSDIKIAINNIDAHQAALERNSGEMLEQAEAQTNIQQEISETTGKFGEIIHGEVIEIEDSMDKTNKLLTEKFDEFSELLKKSNTEALVEVMKNVTEEFQKQMNALINKLIQENFDQLNKSVERLNTWQIENKEMIQSLTSQYKKMAENFEGTSNALNNVEKDTKCLVDDESKLQQIVKALNTVMVEDEKFIQITSNLSKTTDLAKNSYEQFDESTKSLNEWVRKQRNFVDGVQMLIVKLEELNKLKDYGEQFWQSTKHSMEEGVDIIAKGSETLNNQLTNLDRQFYNRLNATLSELDTCIQAMINGRD